MGETLSDIRQMIDLAKYFRQCADETGERVWQRKMLSAAIELEHRATAIVEEDFFLDDDSPSDHVHPRSAK